MKKFIKNFWPVIFILGVWFAFSAPYFLQHKVPYPSNYQVNFFTPWNQYQELAGPVKNGAMPDVVDQIYPWKHFTIETLKKGQLPLWNPYSFAGTPHVANYQSAVFSPFNLLFFVLPFVDAWSLVVLLQPLLAGLFMYLFLRELKVSKSGSLISSISFMFCGFIVTWMAYGTLSMVAAFLPLALLGVEKGFRKTVISTEVERSGGVRFLGFARYSPVPGFARNDKWIILLPLSIAIAFFSGHFQAALYFALFVFSYLIYKLFQTKNIHAFFSVIIFYFIGIVISLVQIIPTLELYRLAARSEAFSNAGAIPWHYLVTVFSPDFYGNPVTRNDWAGYYAEWGSFIGIIPLTLAFFVILEKKSRKASLFFLIAGLTALLFAIDSPFQKLLLSLKLPVFSTSIPSRIIFLFSFSFAVLAGFGFDALFENLKKKSFRKLFSPFVIAILLISIIWILLFVLLPKDKVVLAARNMVLPSLFLSIAICVIALCVFVKKKFLLSVLMCVLVCLTAFDSLRFVNKWMPFDPKERVFPKMPVIEAMQKNAGNGRVYGDFGAFLDTYYGLSGIEGYDPLYSKRYGEFIQSASAGEFVNAQRSVVSLDKRAKYADRVLDLLGINLIYHPYSNTDKSWAYPVWDKLDKYELLYKDNKFQVFKNKTALPRVKMFYSYEVVKEDKKIIERFYDDKFDFRNVLILEEAPKLTQNKELKTKNKTDIISYTPNKITINVVTDRPGILFLSDSYYPKWKVKVNGTIEKIYRADYTFRAVVVPQGKSEVEFEYSLF